MKQRTALRRQTQALAAALLTFVCVINGLARAMCQNRKIAAAKHIYTGFIQPIFGRIALSSALGPLGAKHHSRLIPKKVSQRLRAGQGDAKCETVAAA